MRIVVLLLLSLLLTGHAGAELIWLEAEHPSAGSFPARNPFAPREPAEREALSGGDWIGVDGRRDAPLFLVYRFSAAAGGEFSVYARKFWKHGPFRWRVNDGAWRSVGKEVALIDRVTLRKNVEANWVRLGTVELAAGWNTLRIELTENAGPAAFDCFVLTDQAFTPRGKLKPGERLGSAPEGWFAFEPDDDPPTGIPIDLRFLNESFAGEQGRLVARGDSIVHEQTGRPVRWWGVNAGADVVRLDRATLDRLGAFLARRGVNLVRVHMPVGDARGVDDTAVSAVQAFVAAMKPHGIYTALSIYFPLWMKLRESDGFGSYKDQHPFALVFFDEKFQQLYRSWFHALLTRPNPHAGGIPLSAEPAVALVEMVNEDSLLFWTTKPYETIPAEPMGALERRFGLWAKARYGSIEAAFARWNRVVARGDDFASGRVGVMGLWDIIHRKGPRAEDTAAFLADLQTQFFLETRQFLRDSCGYGGLIVGSNWQTADARLLGPLDKLSNTVADVMDRHGYYAGKHQGQRAAYAIDAGDQFFDRAAVRFDSPEGADPSRRSFHTPIWDVAYAGKPSIISEINWSAPNRFRSEMPLLAAAYGSLAGSDGLLFFALEGPGWSATIRKFSIQTPAILGQFPAAALVYRRGDIESAPAVVRSELHEPSLRRLLGGPPLAEPNLDALREKDLPPQAIPSGQAVNAVDPLAFAVGRVEAVPAERAGIWQSPQLATRIDRQGGVVRSITGQLTWDFSRGVVTVNAPKVQAACGFLSSAGRIELNDCTWDIGNEFAAVWLVSLDDVAIGQSRKLLLAVVTEEMNQGFRAEGHGPKTIVSIGGPPVCVREIRGHVELKGPPVRITPLTFEGQPAGERREGSIVKLDPTTIYYILER
ncbi:MAG: hypothetical protein NZ561_04630 [Phycisphaerae bacterium]|nr:hypothetical protein [Phycisphaerae bacterium]MDW8261402.1 hypothetical protein [Phycisphaerales bacterium]